jgi:hypothetical protein
MLNVMYLGVFVLMTVLAVPATAQVTASNPRPRPAHSNSCRICWLVVQLKQCPGRDSRVRRK